ncbi:MAG: 3'(2'),5'-bisphosphate nucleotidase CysQ [Alphaproteobacteria bacterium]
MRELARSAGDAIMAVYRTDFDAERKEDGSPVTEADKAAEAAIVPGLRALAPDIPVISEEEFSAGESPDKVGRRFWLVDPLDGTREFLKRNDEFTVNIGLIEDNVPVLGVLYAPALDLMYAGAGPGTATLTEGGRAERPIFCRLPPADGLGVLVSRSHSIGGKVDEYLAAETIRERIPQGSALKFGRLAEGVADIYPRFGPTCEWDTAAGHAIVLAAGGSLTKIDGTHFDYGKKEFLNPGFVAFGRR